MRRLCRLSMPLAVALFCGGALGALLRIARRLVASQPRACQESFAASLIQPGDGLLLVVAAFGPAVPQARAPSAAKASPRFGLCTCWKASGSFRREMVQSSA